MDDEEDVKAAKCLAFLRQLYEDFQLDVEGPVDACDVTEALYNFMNDQLGWPVR